jgi:phosphate starvation-inducible PhoH-like protein
MTGTPNSSSAGSSGAARAQTKISVSDPKIMVILLGAKDEILRLIERTLASDVHVRGNEITITGDPAENAIAERLFAELIELIQKGETLSVDSVRRTATMLEDNSDERPAEVLTLNILSRRGRTIRPKTLGQKRYVDSIDQNTIVFGIGPAGTGKTYLAMAKAVQALTAKQVSRIILTRPAVEAGERLGFLPGTLNEKIDPYLRPLYDALHDMLDPESIPRLMAAGTIEVAPLAYMRGRAQPLTAKVLTPDGWRQIGDLAVGDLVVGSGGLPTPVLGVFPQGRKPVYRVTTQDGASTLACGEHLWTVRTPDDRRPDRPSRVVQTQDMIGELRRGTVHRYELPLVEPVEFVPQEVPMAPYALGLLLGDGCLTTSATPAVAPTDPELAEAIEAALPGVDHALHRQAGGARGGVLVADPVTAMLRELGLAGATSKTRFVPESYLMNTAAVRTAVLQGLFDTDGCPVTRPDRTCRVQYTTCSEQLRDDVVFLVRSLGGTASCGRRHDAFLLDIRMPAGIPPFRLGRKRAAYDECGGRPMRFIETIEPAGEDETVCIQVAAADSLYVTDDLIVTHNTLNDAFIILDEAQNTTPEQMKMFLTRLGFGAKIVVTGDVTQVDLPGGTTSGLKIVREILKDVEDVHFAELSSSDVVRHQLVAEIVDAYAKYDAELEQNATQSVHAVPGRTASGGRTGHRR